MVSKYLEISSRLKAIDDGSSDGASCNTFILQDSVMGEGGIADLARWVLEVAYKQGAPTIIASNIRAKGSVTSKGVTTDGVCALIKMLDEQVKWIKKPGKRTACVVFLDANHPDIDEFTSYEFNLSLSTIYLGVLIDPKQEYSDEVLSKLAKVYDTGRIFINKLQYDSEGNALYPNVCNEIRQKHKSSCTLAAIKLHEMTHLNIDEFGDAFAECASNLIGYLDHVEKTSLTNPTNYNFERQVGLGFVGMSNFLGKLGETYQSFVQNYYGVGSNPYGAISTAQVLLSEGFYQAARVQIQNYVTRMFTAQPTAHTALRLEDYGLAVTPELSPVIGGTRASDGLVRVYRYAQVDETKSGILEFPSYVQTQEEVPYEVYREFCEIIHSMMSEAISFAELDLGVDPGTYSMHTFSHCYYGEEFTLNDLKHFLDSPLGSLYYRLEPVSVSRDKTQLTDNAGDISDMIEEDGFCPIDPKERINCETCSM